MDPTLAMTLVAQGMRLWADYADRTAKGTLTDADIDAMSDHLGANLDGLRAEIAAARAAGAPSV